MLLLAEDSGANWTAYTPEAYVKTYPAYVSARWCIRVTDSAGMQTAVDLARARNFGWVYVTDDSGTNPYDSLPVYWATEVPYVAGRTLATPAATFTPTATADRHADADEHARHRPSR